MNFQLRVESDDYKIMMEILSKNLAESDVPVKAQAAAASTPPGTVKTTASLPTAPKKPAARQASIVAVEETSKIQAKYVFLKFSFQLDSIKIHLFSSELFFY